MDTTVFPWPQRRAAAFSAVGLVLSAPFLARADADVEGTVIALDSGDLVLDLGSLRGASEGDVVELWRPLKLRHPLTGRPLSERFRIGALRLKQVRPAMALAEPDGDPSRPPVAGDIVILRRSEKSPSRPESKPVSSAVPSPGGSSSSAPTAAPPPSDPESDAIAQMLVELRGAPPEARIARYEDFLRRWPTGKAARTLSEEVQLLRLLLQQRAAPDAARKGPAPVAFLPPTAAVAGRPVELVIQFRDTHPRAVLHFRGSQEATYTSRPMESAGPGYHMLRIDGVSVQSPELLYFIEMVGPDGQAQAVIGSAEHPRSMAVLDPTPTATLGRGPVTAALWVDYANFNRLRNNDYLVQTEGYFGVRLQDEGIRAVRSGFGVLRGRGGTLDELDKLGLLGRSVGLTYGYLEGEYATSPTFALVGRLVLGLRRDGVGSGGQFFLRFGSDQRTNLLLGGEFLGGVGLRGITQLEWRTIPRVPIVLRTEVTNQPAGEIGQTQTIRPEGPTESTGQGEVGLRAIVQAGYELFPSLTLSARASYQGRTINHAGPGLGAAVSYQW